LVDLQEPLDLGVNKLIVSLYEFGIHFVPHHEGSKYPEDPGVEIVSKNHGPTLSVFAGWKREADAVLVLANDDFV